MLEVAIALVEKAPQVLRGAGEPAEGEGEA
jgi:hypothetical protein